jgi:arginine-tRNA-protein transferase
MVMYTKPQIGPDEPCPYLPDKTSCMQFFFAAELDEDELELFLSGGWRKFGYYYFRPVCRNCVSCISVRIPVDTLQLSKNQKRVIKRNADVLVKFTDESPLQEELFILFKEHSRFRFQRDISIEEYEANFCARSCSSLISKYYLGNKLSAIGYLDKSSDSLSSVYFIYTEEFICRSPGIFSILKEIDYAKQIGLKYYYLGYLVEGNSHMQYKGTFYPYEKRYESSGEWNLVVKDS